MKIGFATRCFRPLSHSCILFGFPRCLNTIILCHKNNATKATFHFGKFTKTCLKRTCDKYFRFSIKSKNVSMCALLQMDLLLMEQSKLHRTDIDGLRGIAVLAVVIFHINPQLLPGGFVGVDIFFAISGFLITQQLLKQLQAHHTFSLSQFFQRRIRRLLPAALMVVATTTIISQAIMRPEDASAVAKSAVAASVSMANIYFYLFQDTSYFAASSLESPLLHLWSLGVEEQFYLVWPLLLLLFRKQALSSIFLYGTLVIAMASFAFADRVFSSNPMQAYYMLHTRAGELLLGAIAAWITIKHPSLKVSRRFGGLSMLIGMGLVIFPVVLLNEQSHFPGYSAIPPVAGTMLLLLAGHYQRNNVGSTFLSTPVLGFFGAISYSLYLWHWPIMAIFHYGNYPLTPIIGVGLFVIMVILGWLSYRYIETPFRKIPATQSPRHTILKIGVIPTTLMLAGAIFFYKVMDGYAVHSLMGDYNARRAAVNNELSPANKHPNVCQRSSLSPTDDMLTTDRCITGATENAPSVFLIGDSNAAHYVGALTSELGVDGVSMRNATMGSCPPLIDSIADYAPVNRKQSCANGMPRIWEAAMQFDKIIISASWTAYQKQNTNFQSEFERQLKKLTDQGKQVLLLGKAPRFPEYDRLCREKALTMPWVNCDVPKAKLPDDIIKANQWLQSLASRSSQVYYADFNHFFCDNALTCSVYGKDGQKLFYDAEHITSSASWKLGKYVDDPEIKEFLLKSKAPRLSARL